MQIESAITKSITYFYHDIDFSSLLFSSKYTPKTMSQIKSEAKNKKNPGPRISRKKITILWSPNHESGLINQPLSSKLSLERRYNPKLLGRKPSLRNKIKM